MKNRGNLIFAVVLALIVIIAVALMFAFGQKGSSNESSTTAPANTATKTSSNYKKINTDGQPMMGEDSAPVTLIEFGDYKCPACKYFDENIQPELVKKYVDKGDLKMYFINTPFHGEESLIGANAAEYIWKNEPKKYWDFHNALFKAQPNTQDSTTTKWLTNDVVKKAAQTAKVSDVDGTVKAGDKLSQKTAVEKDINLYQKYMVQQTPTIIINGKKLDDPLDKEAVEKAIEAAKK